MQTWQVLLIILGILAAVLIGLYIMGRRMQKRQEEAQVQIDAMKQVTSILVIDKKMLPLSKSGLPQAAIEQTPKLLRWQKLPIVKAKVGPQILTMACDKEVFDILPVQKECKVEVSGIYITGIKSVRGGSIPQKPRKLTLKERVFGSQAEKQAEAERLEREKEAEERRLARKAREEQVAARRAEAAAAKAEAKAAEKAAAAEAGASGQQAVQNQAKSQGQKKSGKSNKNKHKGHSGDPNRGKK